MRCERSVRVRVRVRSSYGWCRRLCVVFVGCLNVCCGPLRPWPVRMVPKVGLSVSVRGRPCPGRVRASSMGSSSMLPRRFSWLSLCVSNWGMATICASDARRWLTCALRLQERCRQNMPWVLICRGEVGHTREWRLLGIILEWGERRAPRFGSTSSGMQCFCWMRTMAGGVAWRERSGHITLLCAALRCAECSSRRVFEPPLFGRVPWT